MFRFQPPRARISWRALRALDLHRVAQENDLDALERVLDAVAHGDLQAADPKDATPEAVAQLFGVAQLAVQYLLYVQDRLSVDSSASRAEAARAQRRAEELRARAASRRQELSAAKQEARQLRREVRALEAAAARALPVPEPQASERLRRLEGDVRELADEREAARREARSLREALAAATAQSSGAAQPVHEMQAAAEAARRAQQAAERVEREAEEQWLRHRREIEEVQATRAALQAELDRMRACAATTVDTRAAAGSAQGTSAAAVPSPALPSKFSASPKKELQQDLPPASPIKAWHVSAQLASAPAFPSQHAPQPRNPPAPPPAAAHVPPATSLPPPRPPPAGSPAQAAAARRPLTRELPFELAGNERPGVVSRFPHRLSAMRAMRHQLQEELQGELRAELEAHGVDPAACQGLSSEQYAACMGELERRRAEARQAMAERDRSRADYMRDSVAQHVAATADRVGRAGPSAQRPGAGGGASPMLQSPGSLRPIRTTGGGPTATPRAPANLSLVDRAVSDAHDDETDAFYSPLRRGNSSAALASTPRSDAAAPIYDSNPAASSAAANLGAGGRVENPGSSPHSPWAQTHQRIVRTMELAQSASPLRDASPRKAPSAANVPYAAQATFTADTRDYDTEAASALHLSPGQPAPVSMPRYQRQL